MRVLIVIFSVMLVTLQYRLWIGSGSFPAAWKLDAAVAAQLKENQRLETRNLALEAEVRDLKTGDAAIEERARSELGMVGQDETFFQIIDNGRADPGGQYKRAAWRCKDKDKCILPGFGP
ncbi:MAG TPA: cell division protein FtsB [Gammaproteobacteria bacterium]|nr:cell division protein FtsB [Gammaproteobacteria bacterium]